MIFNYERFRLKVFACGGDGGGGGGIGPAGGQFGGQGLGQMSSTGEADTGGGGLVSMSKSKSIAKGLVTAANPIMGLALSRSGAIDAATGDPNAGVGVSGSEGGGGVGGGPGDWTNYGSYRDQVYYPQGPVDPNATNTTNPDNTDPFNPEEFTTGVDDIFLTDEERAMLDEIEANRVKMLTDTINEKVYEVQQSEIARLVDRGVLQSDVGAESMAKTRDYASRGIEEGTLSIGTQRMQDEMNFMNSKRDFALKEDALNWDMNKFTKGLEWQTEQSALDRSLSEKINKNMKDYSDKANKYDLFGNVIGGAFDYLGSDNADWLF